LALEVFTLGEGGLSAEDAMVHDETSPLLAQLLVRLEVPKALGVIHCVTAHLRGAFAPLAGLRGSPSSRICRSSSAGGRPG
jgi:hypothetical protein